MPEHAFVARCHMVLNGLDILLNNFSHATEVELLIIDYGRFPNVFMRTSD